MDETTIEALEAEESMFVQTAQGITSDGGTLTLLGVTPATLYFSDRPQRVVGHLTTADFVDLWDEGENSFESDPPNAVLSFLLPGDDVPEDAVVVIKEPRLDDLGLTYAIDVLEGKVPAEAGPVTLFIDPFGRPFVPGLGRRGAQTGSAARQAPNLTAGRSRQRLTWPLLSNPRGPEEQAMADEFLGARASIRSIGVAVNHNRRLGRAGIATAIRNASGNAIEEPSPCPDRTRMSCLGSMRSASCS